MMHDDGENDENANANGDYDDLLNLEVSIFLALSRVERLFINIICLIVISILPYRWFNVFKIHNTYYLMKLMYFTGSKYYRR